jgi:cell division topological specificity factor
MKLLDYFRRDNSAQSASVARERLQIVVAHQRGERDQPDFLPEMQKEIIAVIQKYVSIDEDQVSVQMDSVDNCSVLELNVTLPSESPGRRRSPA